MSHYLPDKIFRTLFCLAYFTLNNYSPVDAYINQDPISDTEINLHSDHLIRGERLFYGLVYLADRSVNCADCHNTKLSSPYLAADYYPLNTETTLSLVEIILSF